MVIGKYVFRFSEASHVMFEGHLDDPSFRSIAVQSITKLEAETVTLDTSGPLKIENRRGREIVTLTFECPLFGKQKTTGHPFKDEKTDSAAKTGVPQPQLELDL